MSGKKKLKKQHRHRRDRVEIDVGKLDALVDKACAATLTNEEGTLLKTSIHAMAERLLPRPRTTEKADALKTEDEGSSDAEAQDPTSDDGGKKRRRGHGRRAAADFVGATVVHVPHPDLTAGSICPGCQRSKLAERKQGRSILRIVGMPAFQGTRYELQVLECGLCDAVYTAPPPPGIGEDRYDASVSSMIGMYRYGSGFPFNRIEIMQKHLGVPLPASVQYELVAAAAQAMKPAYRALVHVAAQAELMTYDDTSVRIIDEVERPEGQSKDRTGLHTTGVISEVGEHRVGLYFSGPKHAGENMADLLRQRENDLLPPTLMADALSHNVPKVDKDLEIVLANCLTHGRRQFVDILEAFPDECHHVIEQIGLVYHYDAEARLQGLDPEARLRFHQENSGPVMDRLKTWMLKRQEEEPSEPNATEPNSGLGKAIRYFLKRWDRLTLFLSRAGAPLDSNVVERALKKSVLHRKNSLFYKTINGAEVGDIFMSFIHTCQLNDVNPFEYLTELQRHAVEVANTPDAWLPWNFREQLSRPP